MFTRLRTHLLPLLSALILVGCLHGASGNGVSPDALHAAQHYEEMINTLHDVRDALRQRSNGAWRDEREEAPADPFTGVSEVRARRRPH
ncbi:MULTISPECIES: hypothetical protein [Edwardsiella]|uniref:Lipoprotein, putative n=2 Tax=Edwardsiella anguillarum TaxID=1821960 RepID=A0A076LS03_9GAMM|nr:MULTISPECIES: hypothetical protein [Edwardsiella]AKM48501.1 hypothetical protein QY76_15425 [Edwardsiella sp. EA181011]GAJ67754.1 hypothetical protein MA13_contig00007-0062 [Edwardsiella piscicida]AIJ09323.1 lipoprotein, putative [Edwardsiella anguillarum ET080813]AKR77160.1 hypothetical protein AAZ33_05030 [Edwardsiella sp. LADL05-105]KAB0589452.1 hypothetical protein F7P84_14665 [Edwardsiella anguillarum]